jgi:hypothetical protein
MWKIDSFDFFQEKIQNNNFPVSIFVIRILNNIKQNCNFSVLTKRESLFSNDSNLSCVVFFFCKTLSQRQHWFAVLMKKYLQKKIKHQRKNDDEHMLFDFSHSTKTNPQNGGVAIKYLPLGKMQSIINNDYATHFRFGFENIMNKNAWKM